MLSCVVLHCAVLCFVVLCCFEFLHDVGVVLYFALSCVLFRCVVLVSDYVILALCYIVLFFRCAVLCFAAFCCMSF